MSQTQIDRVAVTRRTLCNHTRRTVCSRQLSAEVLGEEELSVHAYRAGKDILLGQVHRNSGTLVHDRLVHLRDIIPVKIGAGRQLQQFAEQTVLRYQLDS